MGNAGYDPLSHGVATTLEMWTEWLPVLARRFRLLRFDMRGFGGSSDGTEGHSWSVDRLVEDILAVANAAGVRRFHFIGESFGGTLGFALAARYPSNIISLTVANGAPRGGLVQNLSSWADLMRGSTRTWSDQMMQWRFAPQSVEHVKHEWFRNVQEHCDSEAILAVAELLSRTDLSGELSRIAAPTLLLAPDRVHSSRWT